MSPIEFIINLFNWFHEVATERNIYLREVISWGKLTNKNVWINKKNKNICYLLFNTPFNWKNNYV